MTLSLRHSRTNLLNKAFALLPCTSLVPLKQDLAEPITPLQDTGMSLNTSPNNTYASDILTLHTCILGECVFGAVCRKLAFRYVDASIQAICKSSHIRSVYSIIVHYSQCTLLTCRR